MTNQYINQYIKQCVLIEALSVTYFSTGSINITYNKIHTTLVQNSDQRLYLFNFNKPGGSNSAIVYNTYIVINYKTSKLFNKGLLARYITSSSKILNFTVLKSFIFTSAETDIAIITVNITAAL